MPTSDPTWQGPEAFLPLEPRALLSAIHWDGGGDGANWNDPANWAGDVLPGLADDVTIDVPGSPTIVHDLTSQIRSLVCREHLRLLASGFLVVDQEWRQAGPLDIAGGSVSGAGNLVLSGAAHWTSGDVLGTGKLQIVPGGALDIDGASGSTLTTTRLIVDNGYLRWSGGNLALADSAGIRVIRAQKFDAFSPYGFLSRTGSGAARLELGGVLNTAGPSVTFDVPVFGTSTNAVINAGAVFQQFRGVGTPTGTISGALGNTNQLNLAAGTSTTVVGDFKLMQQGAITGPGSFYLVPGSGFDRREISGTISHRGLFQVFGASVILEKPSTFSILDLRNAALLSRYQASITAGLINSDGGAVYFHGRSIVVGSITGTGGRIEGAVHALGACTLDTWSITFLTADGDVIFSGGHSTLAGLDGPGSALIAEGATLDFGGTLGKNLLNRGTLRLYRPVILDNVTLTNEGAIDTLQQYVGWPFYFQSGGEFRGRGAIINHATMTFDTSSPGLIDGPSFDNPGTVIVRGRLQVAAASVVQIQGDTLAGGTWIVDGGSLLFPGSNLRVNRATIAVRATTQPTTTVFPALIPVERNEGSLEVGGGATLRLTPAIGTLTNTGLLKVGLNSSLIINGSFAQTPAGELAITAHSEAARGRVTATGLSLAGRLRVLIDSSPAAPPIGGPPFPIVIGFVRSGQFDDVLLPSPPAPASAIEYDASSVRLAYT